ncbi:MAG: CBS domain-containing protein, partial [Myxococcales bacterium]|nr:CBS domain-containing protein [Sorangiineae bacterium PRO1]MCL4755794.1 CBS domain-containing protein [Myxococcales bacterium]
MSPTLPKTVGEVMTRKVVTVTENDTIASLDDGFKRFRFRHMPVVDGDKLTGLVTHRDLLHASSSFLSSMAEQRDALIYQQPVKLIMQKNVVTVGPGEPLLEAARLMWDSKLGCLPVVEGDDHLVGIVT